MWNGIASTDLVLVTALMLMRNGGKLKSTLAWERSTFLGENMGLEIAFLGEHMGLEIAF